MIFQFFLNSYLYYYSIWKVFITKNMYPCIFLAPRSVRKCLGHSRVRNSSRVNEPKRFRCAEPNRASDRSNDIPYKHGNIKCDENDLKDLIIFSKF